MGELEQLDQLGELGELLTPAAHSLRPAARIGLAVLQPTPYCNLDCAYCYLPHRDDRRAMRDETLDAIGRNLLASPRAGGRIDVVWHGGEPMTLRPAWYDRAFARLAAAAPGVAIRHRFQTNALGVNDAWIDLWRRWDVALGVSLDGPQDLHDAGRRTRGGGGSFAPAMRGIARLQAAGLRFQVICVLGAQALGQPDRMLDFFLAHDLRDVAFNVEETEGAHPTSSLDTPDAPAAYARFLARIARRIRAERLRFACREIEAVRGLAAATPEARRANPQAEPLAIVTVGVDGRMSTFSPELLGAHAPDFDDFAFADVHRDGPDAMLASPAYRRAAARIEAGIEACARGCAYFDVCGGGAPANKFFELGAMEGTETLYCRLTRQAALDGVLGALEGAEA